MPKDGTYWWNLLVFPCQVGVKEQTFIYLLVNTGNIFIRFGSRCFRIFRLLLLKKHMEQKQASGEMIRQSTGKPPFVGGPLKSQHQSFVIYRRNTDEQYGGYNLFQYAEFKANDSMKV